MRVDAPIVAHFFVFSTRQDTVDTSLPRNCMEFYSCALHVTGTLLAVVVVAPVAILGLAPVCVCMNVFVCVYACMCVLLCVRQ